jgi:hypothetical protein
MRRYSLVALAAIAALCIILLLVSRPSHEREWVTEQTVLPAIRFDGSQAHIANVRSFRYRNRTEFTEVYDERSFDLNTVESAWFVLTPFSNRWRAPAHSFVSFGFADGRFLAISVEARRETGEGYGMLPGLLRRFELVYVLGDERDLIGQRAAFSGTPVYLYPIRAPRESIRQVLAGMLQRAEALKLRPEFYNTLTNSCMSNLVRHVNEAVPGTVPGGLKTLLPGYADEVALRLGLIDDEGGISAMRERYRINELAARYIHDPEFSARIRDLTPGQR